MSKTKFLGVCILFILASCTDEPKPAKAVNVESVAATGTDILTDAGVTRILSDGAVASDVAINSTFLVTFSKEIDPETVTAESIQIKKGGEIIPAEIMIDGTVAVITPDIQLQLETSYVLSFASSIKAEDGGTLTETTRSFSTQDNPIADGLVAHYTFESGSALDKSTLGNNGVITGALPDKDKTNRANESLKFSNITDRVYVASPSFLSNAVGTFAVWVKFNGSSGNPQYVGGVADEASTAYYMSFIRIDTDNTIGTYWRNNAEVTWLKSSVTVTTGVYYHMVFVADGTKYKIYVNGNEITLTTFQGVNNGKWIGGISNLDNFTIGTLTMKEPYVVPYVIGNIDEVRLYNRVLSTKEISLLYTMTK